MSKFIIPSIFKAIDQYTGPVKNMESATNSLAMRAEAASIRTQRSFTKFADAADGAVGKIINLKNAIIAAGAIAAGKKLFDMAAETASFGDELATTSMRLGISTQAFQELSYASKLQNIEEETLTKSLEKLNKNLGELHNNQGVLKTSLEKSNPALMKQLKHAKDANEAFDIVSVAINKMHNQMDRAALATAAFGKSGQQMLNLIQAGPEAIQKMRQEAHKLGIVLSDETIAAASKFDDAHDAMNVAMKGLQYTIGSGLIPIVQDYMQKATSWMVNNRELIKDKVADFVTGIANALMFLSDHFDAIKTGAEWFIGSLIAIKLAAMAARTWVFLTGVATFIYQGYLVLFNQEARAAILVQWALNAAMLANPVTWITLGIIALIAAIVWVTRKTEGWGEQWDATLKWMKSLFNVFKLYLTLQFQMITLAFWTMVDAVVLAWKWGQNKLGFLSDEQFAKDKARILEEQKMRVAAIKETVSELARNAADVAAGPGWHVRMKQDESDAEQRSFISPINPKAQQQQMMQQLFNHQFALTQKQSAEITIKDQSGKAEVTKNPNNIPIKLTPTIGNF